MLVEHLKVGLRCDGDHGDKGMVNQRADYRMIRHASRRLVTSENQVGILTKFGQLTTEHS